jgi:hypothetical protein
MRTQFWFTYCMKMKICFAVSVKYFLNVISTSDCCKNDNIVSDKVPGTFYLFTTDLYDKLKLPFSIQKKAVLEGEIFFYFIKINFSLKISLLEYT